MGTLTCLQCGQTRVGNFRFCRACGFDFDTLPPVPTPTTQGIAAGPQVRRRQTVRMPEIPVQRILLFASIAALGISAIALLTRPVPGGAVAGITSPPSAGGPDASPVSPALTPLPVSGSLSGPVGDVQRGKVVKVIDGDSILVDLGGSGGVVSVRYIGIDAPAPNDGDVAHAWMDDISTRANVDLVAGRTVLLERDATDRDLDGRLLRDVWTDRGGSLVLVNLELVRGGYAQASSAPPNVRYDAWLAAAQVQATAAGLGMWGPAPSASPASSPSPSPASTGPAGPSGSPTASGSVVPSGSTLPPSARPSATPGAVPSPS